MKAHHKTKSAKLKQYRRRSRKQPHEHSPYRDLFAASKCYFSDTFIGYHRRQVELDVEMYWYGLRRSDHALLTHARRHFVKHAYKHWSKVSKQVIRMLFHDPRFAFIGELKELAVRVARDQLCLKNGHPHRIRDLMSTVCMWTQREFWSMLQDELKHSWTIGQLWAHPPPNTWFGYERQYRIDLAGRNGCQSRC
jgi:hypothetical protein